MRTLTRQRGEQASETLTRRDETATRYSQRVELGDPLTFDVELHFWCNRCNQAHGYAFAQAPGGVILAERVITYQQPPAECTCGDPEPPTLHKHGCPMRHQ